MIVKLYGTVDILAGVILLLMKLGLVKPLGFVFAAALVFKSMAYLKDIASIVDILAAGCLVLASLGYYHFIFYIFSLWLMQKGVSSLLS